MRTSKRIVAVTAAALLIVLGAPGPANAAVGTGQALDVGDSHCTDYDQSDNGTAVNAQLFNATGVLTVRRAATVGGQETVVFQTPIGALTGWPGVVDETVPPTEPGVFLYRVCLEVGEVTRSGSLSLASYGLTLFPTSAGTVVDVGPETAALSQNAGVCADATEVVDNRVRLVGSAGGEVRWRIFAHAVSPYFEGDPNVLVVDADAIDQVAVLDSQVFGVQVCVDNLATAARTAVSFELSS
ncbi:MAG TPA: hypothetical protein VFC19_48600 [Candidatus Limnocylindrales bacterium]|nr:hypothetical protein [Candidatus Limnocylindrales bacterium]